ncbi:hypothetical protein [Actinocorallia longicatena]|uniref:Lipoprotein n=1 Tax=Actinocorallia longicatena TaxID=111803 RepID=A0ABP6QBC2_9ACTN
MSRVLVLAVAATAGLSLLTGCTKGDSPQAAPVTAPPSATAGTDPTSAPSGQPTGAAPTTGPSTAPPVGAVVFKSAQDAVDHLLAAWKEGDRTAALQAAGPNTVTKVWALPKQAEKQIEACDKTDGALPWAYNCYWRYEGGSTHFYVNPYAATGYRVENFEQIAD